MKKYFLLALIATFALIGFTCDTSQETNLLENRFWISYLPVDDRDKFFLFVAFHRHGMGKFEHTSSFQGDFDWFQYETEKDRIHIKMLQHKKKSTGRFKTWPCREKGFDYCLELLGVPRGPTRYYSFKGWEINSKSDIETLKQKILKFVQ